MQHKILKKIIGLFGYKLIEKNTSKNERLISHSSFLKINKLLEILFLEKKISNLIQIGANDGERFDLLNSFIKNLLPIMYSTGHEYIDLFTKGLDEKIILEAGFMKVDNKNNDVIIPNYFEPFVQKNVCIRYFTDTKNLKDLRIYKGDGDQDRPSFII